MKTRNSVRVILLNDRDEVLLLHCDDPSTTSTDGVNHGPFWFLVGGGLEENEDIFAAARREIFEETNIAADKIEFGPVVWWGEQELVLCGHHTKLHQRFVVAHTREVCVSLQNVTEFERTVIKNIAWFSVDQIASSTETIYPFCLPTILPNIIAGVYPSTPLEINLREHPRSSSSS